MIVWSGRLRGARTLGWVSSSVKSAPRLCSTKPVPAATRPLPNPALACALFNIPATGGDAKRGVREGVAARRVAKVLRVVRHEGEAHAGGALLSDEVRVRLDQDRVRHAVLVPMEGRPPGDGPVGGPQLHAWVAQPVDDLTHPLQDVGDAAPALCGHPPRQTTLLEIRLLVPTPVE